MRLPRFFMAYDLVLFGCMLQAGQQSTESSLRTSLHRTGDNSDIPSLRPVLTWKLRSTSSTRMLYSTCWVLMSQKEHLWALKSSAMFQRSLISFFEPCSPVETVVFVAKECSATGLLSTSRSDRAALFALHGTDRIAEKQWHVLCLVLALARFHFLTLNLLMKLPSWLKSTTLFSQPSSSSWGRKNWTLLAGGLAEDDSSKLEWFYGTNWILGYMGSSGAGSECREFCIPLNSPTWIGLLNSDNFEETGPCQKCFRFS